MLHGGRLRQREDIDTDMLQGGRLRPWSRRRSQQRQEGRGRRRRPSAGTPERTCSPANTRQVKHVILLTKACHGTK
jgi:hypothetical protein